MKDEAEGDSRRASPGEVLRSLTFYGVFYGGTLIYVLIALPIMALSPRLGARIVHAWSAFHRRCVISLLGITVTIEGELPRGGALIAMKHESFFEAIDLPVLFDHPAIFTKAELLRIPLWGRAGISYGLIPVERGEGAKALRSMLAKARESSRSGRLLVIFPEGTRVPHGTRPPLRAGFAGLYKLLGLPVVPVAVDSGPLYHRRWKRRGTITVRAGEPIDPGLPRAEVEARVHRAINMLNQEAG